ncbi:cyclic nucleotide-binding domain-containing protein [Aestuariirhabdus sp. LZHN29]|uniref:cyclic nucleotide-binding domain-containing protein n=1 Tax=Aestuariirhabdus sp. LZHN29 TaxID=3417462 RepID=UPI003CFAB11D
MAKQPISLEQIQHLHPLQRLNASAHKQLQSAAEQIAARTGNIIFKKRDNLSPCVSYLLKGQVELRHSFADRKPLRDCDELAHQPLEELVGIGASIRALEDCVVVRFERDLIDKLRSKSSNLGENYSVVNIEEGVDYLSDTLIDDDYQEDWTLQLLDSPLARNLKPIALHRLMALLERLPVKKGDRLVQQGSRADYFYILISGEAVLNTDPNGPFKGQSIAMHEGSHFGEEALLGETLRNATVSMTSDGVMGRLNREQFLEVFSDSLLPTLPEAQFSRRLKQAEGPCVLLDVRFREELRNDTRSHVLNIPISRLRSVLPQLDRATTYLLPYQSDQRSELATCILRQHGFTAYLQQAPSPVQASE